MALTALLAVSLTACAHKPFQGGEPQLALETKTERSLHELPPPPEPIIVAVYDFPDLTGQHKPNQQFPEYSRAVTQGAVAMLIEALQEVGRGQWFIVLERAGLDNLLRERQLIRSTRQQYLGPDGAPLAPPPPLLYAPILLEGGVVSYETNTHTGGLGARYLGIGGSTAYQHDRVTVALRAASTQNGRLLRSVTASKNIASVSLQGGAFRFVEIDKLLEIEAGITANEPPQLAVRRAIEKAVYALVIEGSLQGTWRFADQDAARPYVDAYLKERDGVSASILAEVAPPGELAPAEDRIRVREPDPASRQDQLRERTPSIFDENNQRRRENPPPIQNPGAT
jgi:curli production assembly/transport component CsgG